MILIVSGKLAGLFDSTCLQLKLLKLSIFIFSTNIGGLCNEVLVLDTHFFSPEYKVLRRLLFKTALYK